LDLLAALMGEGGTSTHGTTVSTTDPVLLDLVVEAAAKIGAQVGKVAGDNVDYALTGGALTGAAGIGECMCGCGAPTGVAAESSTARGYAKGDRLRFAKGHTRPETTLKRLRREHGLDFTLAKHKVMPHAVFRLPNDQLARFLGILWMCDGYVGDRRKDVPGISFASQRLVEDVQHLLLRFGIQSSVRHKTARIGEKEFDAWRCEVYRASVPRFAEAIPLWGEKASRAVARASSTTGWHFSGAPTMTDDQWVELREDLAGRSIKPVAEALGWNVQFVGPSMVLRQKPRKSGQRSFCVPGLRACIEMYPDLEAKWGWLVDSELWWDPVVSVEDAGQQQVWDLSVGETANFVANDLVVHNTSTALQAAAALAEAAGKPGEVVLVDANTAQASISTLLDLRNEAVPDIMRLLDPPWDPKKVTRSLTAIPDTNLHVLFAPHNKRDKRIRNITPQLFRRIVNELRSTYRYIVIDTPVAQNVGEPIFDEFVFTDADALVIVTNPEKESQENNLEFAEIACDPVAGGGRAFPMQHLWILLNRARDGVGYDEVNVRDEFRQYNFAGSVPESDAILRAANDGRLHLASSPARDALLHALANITGDESLRPSSAAPTVDGVPRGGGWRGLLAKVGLG
jgi:MinD-like ATPase involved in chromosome partitioning or flagellar assembly